jgi:UDP-2,3-diacylglucosamine hydrolase
MNQYIKKNLNNNLQHNCLVVIADVHLRSLDDLRGTLLLESLEMIKESSVESLVLLGDVFDFFAGNLKFFQKKFAKLFLALTNISDSGIKVFFIQGNHEFYLDHLPWTKIKFVTNNEYLLTLKDGSKIALSHGDMLFKSRTYQAYYNFVRSCFFKKIMSFLPGRLLEKLCFDLSDFSKKRQKNKQLCLNDLHRQMNYWVNQTRSTHAIIGHFHTPFIVRRKKTFGKLVGLHGWEKPNVLLFNGNEFKHFYLQEEEKKHRTLS